MLLSITVYVIIITVITRQLQVERRTAKVRLSETDVLPLCHATNAVGCVARW